MTTATHERSVHTSRKGVWARAGERLASLHRLALVVIMLLLSLGLLGSSALPATQQKTRSFALAVQGWGFDLLAWETQALREKTVAAIQQPAADISRSAQPKLVREYLERARQMQTIEAEIQQLYSSQTGGATGESLESAVSLLQEELDELRALQQLIQPAVEQIIQNQVGWVIVDEGFSAFGRPFPPVQFTFTKPPKKLIVSPRDRIDTVFSRMLSAQIGLPEIEQAEQEISEHRNTNAYITNIGGLGAFPTMVVDQASLEWVLSTVAHEWVHNYLVFHPLGWNYFANQDMTTMNETVAEIVGHEIGARVYQAYYGEPEPAPASPPPSPLTENLDAEPELIHPDGPAPFDFQTQMRITRLNVDQLLAEGKVDGAEAYMEERRQFFVEHGYPLRVLNQAYFAFHGSYGTSPASTSPVGPRLERLRDLMPDLQTFLHTVRSFASVDDLDQALAAWEAHSEVE